MGSCKCKIIAEVSFSLERDKIDDSERLRPQELNQQNIEALVAESNLKMEILPVSDLDVALHNFVNKDDKMAFYSCLQYNLEETRVSAVSLFSICLVTFLLVV
ncbi:double-strand break repair protein MRE11-like [Primulina eburnea]|uniref:double-strand break repair protein MRE11-like n=1 Tax=Primulina eburnea TaxID=1245227 RepID=UPI003C6BEDF1